MSSKSHEVIKEELLEASKVVVAQLAMEAQAAGALLGQKNISGPAVPTPIQALEHTSRCLRTSIVMMLRMNPEPSAISYLQWEASVDLAAGDTLPAFSIRDFDRVMASDDLSNLPPHQVLVITYIKQMRAELKRILGE